MQVAAPGDPLEEGQETEQLYDRRNKPSWGGIASVVPIDVAWSPERNPRPLVTAPSAAVYLSHTHTHMHTRHMSDKFLWRTNPPSLCRGFVCVCVCVRVTNRTSAVHKLPVVPPFPSMLWRQRQLWHGREQKCGSSDLPTVANRSQRAAESCFSQSCRCVYRTVVTHTYTGTTLERTMAKCVSLFGKLLERFQYCSINPLQTQHVLYHISTYS